MVLKIILSKTNLNPKYTQFRIFWAEALLVRVSHTSLVHGPNYSFGSSAYNEANQKL